MSAERQKEIIAKLVKLVGGRPESVELFNNALTHRSWINEYAEDIHSDRLNANERLEFLGDAVLGLVIARNLYERLPLEDEGVLSKAKAHLVSAEILARHARQLKLGRALSLGRGEERSGGRERDSLLANALEAVIGALFLSEGLAAVERFVLEAWEEDLQREIAGPGTTDYKSLLQEFSQKLKGVLPVYHVEKTQGPDHDRVYEISALIGGCEYGRGRGKSKKEAAQVAAAEALRILKQNTEL